MKNSKIPMWPLYLADALMFITVFAIALPSIRYAEDMGLGVAFFCCLMVLGAMAMLLVPYWLEYKKDLAAKAEHTQEASENFKIIFDQLSELQLMIADVEEKREKTEFALEEMKGSSDISTIIKAVSEFKDAVKAKLRENAEANAGNAEKIAELKKELLSKESSMEQLLDKCSESAKEAVRQAEENDKTLASTVADMEILKDMLSAVNDSLGDEISQLRAQILQPSREEIGASNPLSETTDRRSPTKLGNLMQKALGQAEDTKISVSKLVAIGSEKPNLSTDSLKDGSQEPQPMEGENNSGTAEGASGEQEVQGAPQGNKHGSEGASVAEEPQQEPSNPASVSDKTGETDANPVEKFSGTEGNLNQISEADKPSGDLNSADSTPPQTVSAPVENSPDGNGQSTPNKKDGGFDDDIDFFEPADSAAEKSESAKYAQDSTDSKHADSETSDMLFDSLPEVSPKPQKAAKGDSVIVVNALIGIGNKPYIRGDAAGLSPDKGTQMEYLEIGKWRYVAKGLSQPLKFSIYKNDIQPPRGENIFTLEAGQKLEIDLSFPQEQ